MKRAAVFVFTFSLAGCQAISGIGAVKITPRQVFLLESGYTVVRQGFTAYRALPYCSKAPAPCQEGKVALQIQKADEAAMTAIATLDAVSANDDPAGVARAYAIAKSAIDAATQIATIYGVK